MTSLDQIDPVFAIPAALIIWAVYGVIRLHERKLAKDEEQGR